MAKDPAFLFYPNDYIGGTMGMSFEEKGAYIDLLMMQFNRGHMTSHMIGHVLGHDGGHLWVKLQDKFIQDEDGLYFNERLDEEIIKRRKYSESRRNNVSGKNQYTKTDEKKKKEKRKKVGHMDGHMTSHMENENINVFVLDNKGINQEKQKSDYGSEELKNKYSLFQKWVDENAPKLNSMKYPVTIQEFEKLTAKIKTERLLSLMLAMQNKKDLLKKYESVYLTILNWNNNDFNNNKSEPQTPADAAPKISIREQEGRKRLEFLRSQAASASGGA